MSEQPLLDQTHGYNERAMDSIAAMPRDESGKVIPDEEAYNESQKNLESDPATLQRSERMNEWSDTIGAYADRKAGMQTVLEQTVDNEAVKDKIIRSSSRDPVIINSKLDQASPIIPDTQSNSLTSHKPTNMLTTDAFGGVKTLESPVMIGKVQRPKDIENAQIKNYQIGVQKFNDDLKAVDAAKKIVK